MFLLSLSRGYLAISKVSAETRGVGILIAYIDSIAGDYSACPALFLGLVHRGCFSFLSSGVSMVMVVRIGFCWG